MGKPYAFFYLIQFQGGSVCQKNKIHWKDARKMSPCRRSDIMFLSNLLGPVKKPIFEIMYRSSLRAAIQLEESGIELKNFSNRFLRLARADNLKIEVLESQRHFYLVEKTAW